MKNSQKETIEQFLKRGGKVNTFKVGQHKRFSNFQEKDTDTMQVKQGYSIDLLSLGDAEFWFGEHKTKKKKQKQDIYKMLEISDIPQHLIEIIKGEDSK